MAPKKNTIEQLWPADKVERWPIGKLLAYAKNARTHSPEQIAQIVASIKEFGFTNPVLVDESGELIAGHGRTLAAAEMGLTELPTMVARGWTDEQKRAYRLADNQLALNAGWDVDLLRLEVADLQSLGFNTGLIGFDAADLVSLFGSNDTDPDGAGGDPSGHARVGSLIDRFGIAPFTVMNAREGWWQDRKRGWIALGIQSEIGRGLNELQYSSMITETFEGKNPQGKRSRASAA